MVATPVTLLDVLQKTGRDEPIHQRPQGLERSKDQVEKMVETKEELC
jgi:hypothetical protein